jgi:GNAT superfamily N-acetyltransferase
LGIDTAALALKKLNRDEVKKLVCWAKEEGWNPGENDFDVFWKTDPDGFYGFYLGSLLVAGGAVVSYNRQFGFMGLFIVHPDFRSQGIGKKLWYLRRDLLIKRLHKGASIGMDGVVAMQPFYEKGGFNIAFKSERYECVGKNSSISKAISQVDQRDFKKVSDYDLMCFGFERKKFLENWLTLPGSRSFKFSENNRLKGYAVIREVNAGYKIGPLFADNYMVAEALYKACLDWAAGASVYLDIPTSNKNAIDMIMKYEAVYTFECARMYYGAFPENTVDKVYGITTFELG